MTECLLIACELAVQVDSQPLRDDGTVCATYLSSGATLARRIRHAGHQSLTWSSSPLTGSKFPAPYYWTVDVKAGGVRRTTYTVWLRESPEQIQTILTATKRAAEQRAMLPHGQRRKKPWGPL